MAAAATEFATRNELDRVRRTSVLGVLHAKEIGHARDGVDRHIFENATEAECLPDLRLAALAQLDRFRVTAAFDIEDAVRPPAVFVVADQSAIWVGGERRFPGAGQAEEQCGVATFADVRGAVHREYVALRQKVIQHAEDRLFDFPSIVRSRNEDQFFLERDRDADFGIRAIAGRVAVEVACVQDRPRLVVGHRAFGRHSQEQTASEQRVPGFFGDDAELQLVPRVGGGITLKSEQLAVLQVRPDLVVQPLKRRRFHRLICDPIDPIGNARFPDEELIFRRTTGA